MSISSLVLRSISILSFFLCLCLDSTFAQSTPVYTLDTQYSGSTFFDGWNFYDDADPTNGFVTYVNESTAASSGLIQTGTGVARMNVDSTHTYNPNTAYAGVNGLGRPSVRIESQKSWTHGLFIAKIDHMPGGICGTWPAWWTLGSGEWPYNGEIDIIEGVNNQNENLASLHTGGEATITNGQSDNCQWDGGNSVGCTELDTDTASYGTQFNAQGGGTYAMEWTSSTINIWSFPVGQVPTNVNSANPDPSTWGTPSQTFGGPDLHIDSNFNDHRMVFDTTFCGDFAGATWTSGGCAAQTGYSSCAAYVAENPSVFGNAYWQIEYVRVFQQSGSTTSSSSSGTTTSRSSSAFGRTSTMSSSSVTPSNSQLTIVPPAILSYTSSSTISSSKSTSQDPIGFSNTISFHPIVTGLSTVPTPTSASTTTTSSAQVNQSYSTSEGTITVTQVDPQTTTSTLTLVHVGSTTTSSSILSTSTISSSTTSSTLLTSDSTSLHTTQSSTTTISTTSSSASASNIPTTSSIFMAESSTSSFAASISPYYGNSTTTSTVVAVSSPGAFVAVSMSTSDTSSVASTTSIASLSDTSSQSTLDDNSGSSTFNSAADAALTSIADESATSTLMSVQTSSFFSSTSSTSTYTTPNIATAVISTTASAPSSDLAPTSTTIDIATFTVVPLPESSSTLSSDSISASTADAVATFTLTATTSTDSSSSIEPIPTSTALDVITQTVIPLPAASPPSTTHSDTPDDSSDPDSTITSSTLTTTPTPSIDPTVAQANPMDPNPVPFSHGRGRGPFHWGGSFNWNPFSQRGHFPFLRTRSLENRSFPDFNPFRHNNYVSRIEYVCPSTKKRNTRSEPQVIEAIQTTAEPPVTAAAAVLLDAEVQAAETISPRSLPGTIGQSYPAAPVAVEAYSNDASIPNPNPSPIMGWVKIMCVGMMMGGFCLLGLT